MIDGKGRMWLAASVRGPKNPAFCQKGSDHPSAKAFPVGQSNRQLAMLDPKTMKYSFIDTCFTTHHLNFAKDADDTVWASSGGRSGVCGWVKTQGWDAPGAAGRARAGAALLVDTNGNGTRDDYVEQGKPLDGKDMRIRQVF